MDEILRLPPKNPVGDLAWVAGGEVDESSVSLRFFGNDLEPDTITTILGVCPTKSYRKGDVFRGKKYDYIQKIGSWRYHHTRRCAEISLEEQLNSLFDLIAVDLDVWRDLTTKFKADLFCGLWLKEWNRELDFSPAILMRIAERGLRISLDIYCESDEDEIVEQ
jgi:Domain of unknown function (DUF4279)